MKHLSFAAMLLAAALAHAQKTSGGLTTIYNFTGTNGDGATPVGGLALGANGTLYGTAEFGGAGACSVNNIQGCGTVFALSPPASKGGAWTETVIYSFTNQNGDGINPTAGLVIGADGVLYGTTWGGGTAGFGTVFALTPPAQPAAAWSETVIHSFQAIRHGDGAYPYAALTIGPQGELYGATEGGSSGNNNGSVFVLTPPAAPGGSWIETELYLFPGGLSPDGCCPYAGVTLGKNGALYGVTPYGSQGSTVFQLTPSGTAGLPWNHTVLAALNFTGSGGFPEGTLALGNNGTLYGTSYDGGKTTNCESPVVGCGAVFELQPPRAPGDPWLQVTIHEFAGGSSDGANPVAGLVQGTTGTLYGTTTDGPGAVFRLVPPRSAGEPWVETILHNFTGKDGDGAIPLAPLVFGSNGMLFGTTSTGGAAGFGTVFEVTP